MLELVHSRELSL